LKLDFFVEILPLLVPPKNDIYFLEIFSWENILVKSPYYEKGKKGGKKQYSPCFSNHPTPFKK
jgi:hypothetical protein